LNALCGRKRASPAYWTRAVVERRRPTRRNDALKWPRRTAATFDARIVRLPILPITDTLTRPVARAFIAPKTVNVPRRRVADVIRTPALALALV
jgi:hypothetical protein